MIHKINKSTLVPGSVDEVFTFHTCLEKIFWLLPEHVKVTKITAPAQVTLGDKVRLIVRIHAIFFPWDAVIEEYELNKRFVDVLEHGPFSFWRHEHIFTPQEGGTLVTDRIEYKLKFSLFDALASHLFLQKELEHIFIVRHQKTVAYFSGKQTDKT